MAKQTDTQLAHHGHYWHYVRRHRKHYAKQDLREIVIGQIVSLSGAIVAGYVLDLQKLHLAALAGVFMIMPGVFDLGGSIAGAMGARIGHRLGEGHPPEKVIHDSMMHAFALVGVASIFLGLFGATLAALLFDGSFGKVLFVSVSSCLMAAAVGFPLVAYLTQIVFKRGADTDNIIGPIETSIFDTLTILTVSLMVVIIR